MTFRTRRLAVALTEAAVASLGVLSQLVPGASRLVVIMLPLVVLVLASAGTLLNREQPSTPPAAPVFAVFTTSDGTPFGSPATIETLTLAPETSPTGWVEIVRPRSSGPATDCTLRRTRSSRPVAQPGLFSSRPNAVRDAIVANTAPVLATLTTR